MAKQTGEQILEQLMREGGLSGGPAAKAIEKLKTELSKTMKDTLETTKATGKISKQSADSSKESVEISKVANQNIKDIKEGQKELVTLAKQTNGLLNNLLSASSKYYETNNELLQNLLLKNSLQGDKLNEKLQDVFSKQKGAATNAAVKKDEGASPSVIGDVLGAAALAEIAKKITGSKDGKGEAPDKASSGKKASDVPDKASSGKTTSDVPDKASSGKTVADVPDKASSGKLTADVPDKASSGKTKPRQKTTFEQMAEESEGKGKIGQRVQPTLSTEAEVKPSPANKQIVGGRERIDPILGKAPEAPTITPQAAEPNIVWNEKVGRWQDLNNKNKFVSNKVAAELGLTKPGTISAKVPLNLGKAVKGGGALGAAIGIIADLATNPKLEDIENSKAKVQQQLASGEITFEQASNAFKELDKRAAMARGEAVTYSGVKEGIAGAVGTVAGVAATPVTSPVGGAVIGTGVGIATSEGLEYAAERTGVKSVLQKVGEVGGEYTQRFIDRARDELNPLLPGTISSAAEARKQDILSSRFTEEEKARREEARKMYDEAAATDLAERSMYGPEAAAFIPVTPQFEEAQKSFNKVMAETEAARAKRDKDLQNKIAAEQKLKNDSIQKVGSGPTNSTGNVTVINQGDTVNNNVVNGNAGGNKISSGVGSPSGPPGPYDERLYGSSSRRNAY